MRVFAPVTRLARTGHTLTHVLVALVLDLRSGQPLRWSYTAWLCGRTDRRWRRAVHLGVFCHRRIGYVLRPWRQTFTGPAPQGVQSDLLRRRVRMLLSALGPTPEAVAASITTHWRHACGDLVAEAEPFTPLEWYLAMRLRRFDIWVRPWTCDVDGTTVATPAAVRRYLATRHESSLILTPPGAEPATP